MSRTISAGIGMLFLFLFVVLFGLTGCGEKIVTVTEIEHDTLIKTDTLTLPSGPAYIRFVSMLPDRTDPNVMLYRGPSQASSPFAFVGDQMRNEFIPVQELSGRQLYAFYRVAGVPYMDSITLLPLEPTGMYTCAIFLFHDMAEGKYRPLTFYSWDTMKVKPARPGMAYLRLINGLSDNPNPNHINLKIKSLDSAMLFQEPVLFSAIANYIEVPAGTYPVMVVSPDEPSSALYQQQYVFAEGGYYTAMAVGQKGQGSDKLIITTEN